MSTHPFVLRDSSTMLRRNIWRMLRYPSVSLVVVAVPVILLLLFVYVFGGTLGAGLGVMSSGSATYVDYVTPGIVLIAVAGGAQSTAISVAMDINKGVITRFRTMGIARASVVSATSWAARSSRWSDWWLSSVSRHWSASDPTPA